LNSSPPGTYSKSRYSFWLSWNVDFLQQSPVVQQRRKAALDQACIEQMRHNHSARLKTSVLTGMPTSHVIKPAP